MSLGLVETLADVLAGFAILGVALLVAWLVDFATSRFLLRWVKSIASQTRTRWDNAMVTTRVPDRLAHLAPAFVIYIAAPWVFPKHEIASVWIQRITMSFVVVSVALALNGVLLASLQIYESRGAARRAPIKTYVQVGQIAIAVIAVVLIVSKLLGESPWALLSGIGAMTAIIMLVFKDSILGFVASVQLTANDMVRRGDWVEMPTYGADGDVIEVSLNTVKVQNWDKTISMIPTYALIQDSFKNWRGMSESGGRRIKRAVYIDMNSIRFCDEEMLARFQRVALLDSYLTEKRSEIEASNRAATDGKEIPTNLRRLTNVGTFRAYVTAYLRVHPKIHKDMTFMVRQLPPGDRGLPLEIYVFSNDQDWTRYEAIQADIFDHLLAVLPEFSLRVFQLPSGADLSGLGRLDAA